jgi:hypothetical protein
MTPIRNKADLEALVHNKIEESAQLEYKSAESLGRSEGRKREFSKDVSAFANASGGTIIYGLAEAKDGAGPARPDRIDPVNAAEFSKEWLDQIIGQIRPRIPGLEITAIHVGPKDDDYAYVIDIPQGSTAHQALDCKYYARRNFESTPMVDYEIRDVMHRTVHPTIEVQFRIAADFPFDENSNIMLRVKNVGGVMARHYMAVVRLPVRNQHGIIFPEDAVIHMKDRPAYWSFSFTNSGGTPLFPASEVFFKKKFKHMERMTPEPGESIKEVEIAIYADNMPKVILQKDFAAAQREWT